MAAPRWTAIAPDRAGSRRVSQPPRRSLVIADRRRYGLQMRTAGIFAAVALFVSANARAEPKAWTAAKAGLPADAKIVVGVDLAAIQKTQLFATYYPQLLEQAEAAKVIAAIKDTCKIDPLAVVQGLVVAISDDHEDGAAYLAFSGVDKAKLSSCFQRVSQGMADKTAKITLKQDGNITQVSDGKDTVFVGWVGKDVLVVSRHPKDKASLVSWMGGKGALARSELGKSIAKLNTAATLWGTAAATKEIQNGVTANGGYGAVTFAKGNVDADLHAVMAAADQATTMAGFTKQQLDMAKLIPQLPPGVPAMLKAVTVTAAGDEVVFKGSFAEKDLLSAIAYAVANF